MKICAENGTMSKLESKFLLSQLPLFLLKLGNYVLGQGQDRKSDSNTLELTQELSKMDKAV